ncbi:MAG: LysM peptidoglycan-binding domain-containing protein [Anaerolineae bacterium]|nr:LysM peptidoglycan-binding domain-containing protein [Anaerolineae bacterium]MDW8067836.1 LysM peptidoglycan-binding domain-containing protein [Anaerolineae bacterium]
MRKAYLWLMGALLLAFTAQAVSAAPVPGTILGYHVVRSGETLFCIGRAYGVDPWAIAWQNGIVHPGRIYPGMRLAIPAVYMALPPGPTCTPQFGVPSYPPGCICGAYYTIVYGDTLTGIGLRFGVTPWRIAECNGIYNLHYIRAGDTLCIPSP